MRKKNQAPPNEQADPTPTPKTRRKKAVTAEPEVPASQSAPEKPARKRTVNSTEGAGTEHAAPKSRRRAAPAEDPMPAAVFRSPAARGPADTKSGKSVETAGTRKPSAKPKSLAELVEEEKSAPKPRGKKTAKPKPVEPVATEPTPETVHTSSVAKAPSRRGRGRGRDPQPSAEPVTRELGLDHLPSESFEDVLVYWRPAEVRSSESRRSKAPARPKARAAQAEPVLDESELEASGLEVVFRPRDGESQPAPRKRQERTPREDRREEREPRERRSDRDPGRRGGRAAPAQIAEPEPPPEVPKRQAIRIPEDAPQVVLRGGIPTLVRNHRVFPPLAFFGSSPDERRANTVLAEIRRAAEAGVHVHSHLVEFEVDPAAVEASVSLAAYLLAQTVAVDPECQVVFRVVFAAPRGWEQKYEGAKYLTEQGRLAEPSLCDEEFWQVARDCLQDFVRQLRRLDLKDHILGVHLDRGEWFFPQGIGYDTSKAATLAFRDWLRMRYVNDLVALRAAWFDGNVEFRTAQVPEFHAPGEGESFMRTNRKDRRWIDYHLFLSDTTTARIADLAYAAKEASEGYFLVGVNYGYTFEWSHPDSGHLSLGKLLRTREIDYIAGPPSYRSREPGGAAPFPCPVDSLVLNGKLYLSEDDFKTSIGEFKEPDDYNPVIRTPQALESVHWRGIGAALAHGSGAMWMDLWGNGWLNTATIWNRGSDARQMLEQRMAAPLPDPDVAVFIDERALAYLVDQQSFALLVQDVRESVLRSGLSAGFYLLSDLAHRETFPECKLYIFLNAWDIRPEHRLAIKNRLQRDGKVLFWLYCAGMFDNGREALERAREVTGIAIKPQPIHSRTGTTMLNRRHVLTEAFAGMGLVGGIQVDPSYFAIPENAVVLGEYSQSGLPSLVVREFNEDPDPTKHWKSVFFGEPVVTPALLRSLAQMAGAHIWNYQNDVVHVRPPFLTIHCTGGGQRALTLPKNWSAYNVLRKEWANDDSNNVRFQGMDGSTHVFLVGHRDEIEAVLNADPTQVLRLEEPIVSRDDSIQHDALLFDVPIMRLDEMVEGVPDDVSDDWLFRPQLVESDTEERAPEESRVGHRRRRRDRGGRKRDRNERSEGAVQYDVEDVELNVMFRKRD